MVQESFNPHSPKQTWEIVAQAKTLRKSMKIYFETVLILGLLFGMIHPAGSQNMTSTTTTASSTSYSTITATASSTSSPATTTASSTPLPTITTTASSTSSSATTTASSTSYSTITATASSTPLPTITTTASSTSWSTMTTTSSSTLRPSTTVTTATTTSSAVTSNYYNSLTVSSPTFARPQSTSGYYYYQAIQVITGTNGTYTLKSSSSIDTYGCLYQGSFDPTIPSRNLIACDDDSGGDGQFLITRSLLSGGIYVLVVTTYSSGVTGSYWVRAVGPASVYMTSITPSTYYSTSPRPTTSTTPSTFSSALSTHSPMFSRPNGAGYNYYYEAIQTTTYTSGIYTLRSISSIDTYGCLYSTSFNPSSPNTNLIACDDDSGGGYQFLINYYLQYGTTYILVVTTSSSAVTGRYSINAMGPGSVYMTSITPTATTFSGTLSSDSPTFSRPYSTSSSSNYYYASIQTTTNTAGTYTFRSINSMDTYGCLYDGSFDPSNRYRNLLACDDHSGGSLQFLISNYLYTTHTYILVVTTSSSYTTGSYSVTVTGPGLVTMTSITPEPSSLNTIHIVAITFGCVVAFAFILGVAIRLCSRRQIRSSRRFISPTYHSNPPARNVYLPGAQRNAGQMNVGQTPYTAPISTASPPYVEEVPPSYQAYVSNLKP